MATKSARATPEGHVEPDKRIVAWEADGTLAKLRDLRRTLASVILPRPGLPVYCVIERIAHSGLSVVVGWEENGESWWTHVPTEDLIAANPEVFGERTAAQ